MEGSLLARERKKRNYRVLASRRFSFLLERVETIRNRVTYHRAVVPCQPSNRHLFTRACLSISVRTNIRSYVPTEVAYNASTIYRLQRSIYIYRYNRARIAIFFLIRDASFVPCFPIRYRFPLSIHFLPSRNGRGLVANPNSNRISLIFYTMCDDFFMLELSFSLSLFVVLAKS